MALTSAEPPSKMRTRGLVGSLPPKNLVLLLRDGSSYHISDGEHAHAVRHYQVEHHGRISHGGTIEVDTVSDRKRLSRWRPDQPPRRYGSCRRPGMLAAFVRMMGRHSNRGCATLLGPGLPVAAAVDGGCRQRRRRSFDRGL